MQQPKQPNKDLINQSLLNQLANANIQIAERDAVIAEQHQEIVELKKENEELRAEQIKDMNNAK